MRLSLARLEIIRRTPRRARRGPPLLFVHGAYAGAWCWDEFFLPYFCARGYDCHALSLRGHGASVCLGSLDRAGIDDYVDDVRAAARTLDAAPVVVGHSMGGAVAQRYAARHGAAGLVLLASVPPHGLLGTTLELCWRDPALLAQMALVQSGQVHLADFRRLRSALFSAGMPLERAVRYFARMQRESQRALWELSCLLAGETVSEAVPVAVIGGEEDGLFRPDAIRWTARGYAAEAVILPGLGHTMMLDCRWQDAAAQIARWLEAQIGAA